MAQHGYYWSAHWRALRKAALERDGYRCTVEGCGRRANYVDHILTRPRVNEPTPEDRLDNLRSLCSSHDAQIKEHKSGRGRNGVAIVKGCNAAGWPYCRP